MTKAANVQNRLKTFSDDAFSQIVKESFSYSEILRRIGLSTNGGSSTVSIKQRIKTLNLTVSHFRQNGISKKDTVKVKTEDVLKNGSLFSRRSLKRD